MLLEPDKNLPLQSAQWQYINDHDNIIYLVAPYVTLIQIFGLIL